MSRLRLSVAMLIVVLLAAACGGTATTTPAPDSNTSGGDASAAGDPAEAVRGFYTALYGGEGDVASFACAAAPGFADALQQSADASSAAFANATINVSGLNYAVSEQDADSATVTVDGQIIYTVSGIDTPVPYGPVPHNVVVENGAWKVCG